MKNQTLLLSHGSKTGSLELNGVDFYPDDISHAWFSGVYLDLKKGDALSISGQCDVSKCLKLFTGAIEPQSGEIILDGQPIQQYSPEERVKRVGLIERDGFLFNGTIYDNLSSFGQVGPEEVLEIVRLLNIETDILRLKLGFETVLKAHSSESLSVELQQMISIARVLAYKPKIIVYDHADVGLDPVFYRKLYRLLAKLTHKVVLIIHSDDKNILNLAKHHYVVQAGKLGMGTK